MTASGAPRGLAEPDSSRRVLYVEDEDFTRTAVTASLTGDGFTVYAFGTVAEAIDALDEVDPHVLVTDLDLGPGPSGIDLVQRVAQDRPWVGLVVLTAHRSVELAVGRPGEVPFETVMVVKAEMGSMGDISAAVEQSISQAVATPPSSGSRSDDEPIAISAIQAEILHLMAEGLSNTGIAERRGTSLRAAEALVQRTLHALGIASDRDYNSRVLAVRIWQSGRVTVR